MFRLWLSTSYHNNQQYVTKNINISSISFGTKKPSSLQQINNYCTQQSFSSKMNHNNTSLLSSKSLFIRSSTTRYSINNCLQRYTSRMQYHSTSFVVRANMYKNRTTILSNNSRSKLILYGLTTIGISIGIGCYCCTLFTLNKNTAATNDDSTSMYNYFYTYWKNIVITTNNTTSSSNNVTQCEQEKDDDDDDTTTSTTTQASSDMMLIDDNDVYHNLYDSINSMISNLYYTYRIVLRCMKLLIVFTPVITLYPIYYYCAYYNYNDTNSIVKRDAQDIVLGLNVNDPNEYNNDDQNITTRNSNTTDTNTNNLLSYYREQFIQYYYTLCLHCVEHSYSATIIKFMQWVSSRPDLFGIEFCNIFNKLQDHTKPHSDKYTKQCIEDAYGPNWMDTIQLYNVIGSGCIGQVYRGRIKIKKDTNNTYSNTKSNASSNNTKNDNDDYEYHDVAIKVIHPYIMNDIDTDLDILRYMIQCIQYIHPNIRKQCEYLNINGVIHEFSKLLKLQFDLRYEAQNLLRFHTNFKNDTVIQFPELYINHYPPKQNVLIESYCDGIPILQFCRTNLLENNYNKHQLTKLCYHGIRAVCQMIFLDNFVHGDLHPGNVYVSRDGTKFILFDVGIVNEYSYDDHTVLIDVLSAFIRKDGRKAGRCMIDDSNSKLLQQNSKIKDQIAINEEEYIDKIEMLTIKASTEGYFMEHLGTYISYICDAAATHHVMMNPSFVTAALAVKIQEGIALAMDPNCSIPDVAIPIIIESERRRYMDYNTSTTMSTIKNWLDSWKQKLFGTNDK